jgi:hypothetical protein
MKKAACEGGLFVFLHLSHRERSASKASRVRGCKFERLEPPHPNPLPTGERERAVR